MAPPVPLVPPPMPEPIPELDPPDVPPDDVLSSSRRWSLPAAFTISIVAWVMLLRTGSHTWYMPVLIVTVSRALLPLTEGRRALRLQPGAHDRQGVRQLALIHDHERQAAGNKGRLRNLDFAVEKRHVSLNQAARALRERHSTKAECQNQHDDDEV